MPQAKLLIVTGLDLAGKSTQCELIKQYCEKRNYKYFYLHFPIYDNDISGKIISAYLRGEYGNVDETDPLFIANIYAMNRFLYLPELQKNLLENDIVILDRYVFCNMAYQSVKYENEAQANIIKEWINEFEFGFLELPYPDLNIFFDVPIEIIQKRAEIKRTGNDRKYLKGKTDIHESNIEYLKKVREAYLSLKNYQNFEVIKTEDMQPAEVFDKYKHLLDKLMLIPTL